MSNTINNICRTCLTSDILVVPLLEVNFTNTKNPMSAIQLINSFTSVQITESDECPQNICVECLRHLKCLYDFKVKCERSAQILTLLMAQDKISVIDDPTNKLTISQYAEKLPLNKYVAISDNTSCLPVITFDSILKAARNIQMLTNNCELYNGNVLLVPLNNTVQTNKLQPTDATIQTDFEPFYPVVRPKKEPIPTGSFEKIAVLALNPSETNRIIHNGNIVFFQITKDVDRFHECDFPQNFLNDLIENENEIQKPPQPVDNIEDDGRGRLEQALDKNAEDFRFIVKSNGSVVQARKIDTANQTNSDKITRSSKDAIPDDKILKLYGNGSLVAEESMSENSSDGDDIVGLNPGKLLCCLACKERFSKMSTLVAHMINEHTRDSECCICNSKDIRNMQTHCTRHIPNRFYCDHCNKGFITAGRRRKHMRKTKGAIHACTNCERKFCMKDDHQLHMRKHEVKETAPEEIQICCGEEILSKKEFRQHRLRYHINRELYTCQICSITFTNFLEFQADQINHRKEMEYFQCPKCPKLCKNQGTLNLHLRSKHSIHTSAKDNSDISRRRCNICFYVCPSVSTLPSHLRKHTDIRKFSCDLCDRKFSKKCGMMLHRKVFHCNMRRYKCEFCNKAFKYQSNLTWHRETKQHKEMTEKAGGSDRMVKLSEIGQPLKIKNKMKSQAPQI